MNYFLPETIQDAVELAGSRKQSMFFAGGTDLQVLIKQKLESPDSVIDLSRVRELREIRFSEDEGLRLGALVILAELAEHSEVVKRFPLIAEAAESIASPVIRESATVGGNLLVDNRCTFYNQSEDWRISMGSCLRDAGDVCQVTGVKGNCYSRNVSDLAPALIALKAKVTLVRKSGQRTVPLESLYGADGLLPLPGLRKGELLAEIQVPMLDGKTWFRKLRIRRSIDYSSLTIAAVKNHDGSFRICANAISMSPVWLEGNIHEMSRDDIIGHFRKRCKTVDNDLMPLKYRREMLFRWLKIFLTE